MGETLAVALDEGTKMTGKELVVVTVALKVAQPEAEGHWLLLGEREPLPEAEELWLLPGEREPLPEVDGHWLLP